MERLPNPGDNPVRDKVNEIIDWINSSYPVRDIKEQIDSPITLNALPKYGANAAWSNQQERPPQKWRWLNKEKELLANRQGIQWPVKSLTPVQWEEVREDMGEDAPSQPSN